MSELKDQINKIPNIGGLIGALLGALFSMRTHNPNDRPLKNAGKTAVFSGAGFLLGQWLERLWRRR